ncbi:MAG: GGDEF domain-containing protein [Planctomycetota bacterium]
MSRNRFELAREHPHARLRPSAQLTLLAAVAALTAAATAAFGWDAGFHLYLPGLLPLVFLSPNESRPLRSASAAWIAGAYLALHAWLHAQPPRLALDDDTVQVVATANIVCCFLVWGGLAYGHARAVGATRAALERMASEDALTGMPNRRWMDATLAAVEGRRRSDNVPDSALILCDIDHFKAINDRFGHAAGDAALRAVAATIRKSLRAGDQVARWGGEEFLVLLERTDEAEARRVAERIRKAVAEQPVTLGGSKQALSLTLGLALARPDEPVAVSLTRADDALYRGKANGRNQVAFAA